MAVEDELRRRVARFGVSVGYDVTQRGLRTNHVAIVHRLQIDAASERRWPDLGEMRPSRLARRRDT